MGIKQLYRGVLHGLDSLPVKAETLKTTIAEDIAIARKRKLYEKVQWSEEQQREFDEYWLDVYGKKIPNWWHKLYQRASGTFAVDYIPEKLYTTVIEPFYNDWVYAQVLQDKTFVDILARDAACVVPKTIVMRVAGTYYDGLRNPIERHAAEKLLVTTEKAVLKPTHNSSSGNGIIFWKLRDSGNPIADARLLFDETHGDFLVQDTIVQHRAFAAYNESSINTIRITTFVADGAVRHMPIAFRIGREGKRVDNIHAGGIGVGLRDDGSLLSNAYDLGYGDRVKTIDRHPDSGVVFGGNSLPGIDGIVNASREMHGRYTRVGIISWDFTVNEECEPVLIEANTLGQGIWFPQMIHGKGVFGEHTKTMLSGIRK